MSGTTSQTLTVPAIPSTEEAAADALAWAAAQTGTLTDVNVGSQFRTLAEAFGSVEEMQGYEAQDQTYQAMIYSAMALFNIFPRGAIGATGSVTFYTGVGVNPPPAPVAIAIPQGTIVQTAGGVQFQTLETATIPQGATSVSVTVQAVSAGASSNVPAAAITTVATALPYFLTVTNPAPTTGGEDAETPAETLARFTSTVLSLGLGTPVSIANACIGVTVSGTAETVKYATVYEPWIDQAESGVQNPTAGFNVYVDNGSGSASGNLLAAVKTQLDGNFSLGLDGFRPAGVPYVVSGVVPVYADVVVSGVALDPTLDPTLTSSTVAAVQEYFDSLLFAQTCEWTQVVAASADAVAGEVSSLGVTLLNASGVAVQNVTALPWQRVILRNMTASFT